jgi:hypothetical protein
MHNTSSSHRPTRAPRKLGPIGTTARTIVGILLVGSVVQGHLAGPFRPAAWALGLVGFPTLLLGRSGCAPAAPRPVSWQLARSPTWSTWPSCWPST